jgi:hypothetical protein
MCARGGVDELPGDAYAISDLAHATFENVADTELAPDLLYVYRPPLGKISSARGRANRSKRTVPPKRAKNAELRTREHLTPDQVEALIEAAKGNRYVTGTRP